MILLLSIINSYCLVHLYLHDLSKRVWFLKGKFMKTGSLITDEIVELCSDFCLLMSFLWGGSEFTNLCHFQLKKCREGEYRNILLYM